MMIVKQSIKKQILQGSMSFLAVCGLALTLSTDVSAAEVSHVVESGDTLSTISNTHFGDYSQVDMIAEQNGIANPNLIFVGQTLSFDDGKAAVVAKAPTPVAVADAEVAEVAKPVVEAKTETAVKPVVEAAPATAVPTANVPEYVLKVVESEAGLSYQEKANVFSVIVNRANAGNWGGSDYLSVVNAPGQFEVTWTGMADNATVSNDTRQAVNDVLANGVTTSAQSFHASGDGVTNVFY